jgi:hypothetical protein
LHLHAAHRRSRRLRRQFPAGATSKQFRLLTGHYSRWHFHHPGPAFLYLFALGEFVFDDLFHVVPAPYNGQPLIAILFHGALLCAGHELGNGLRAGDGSEA